MMDSPAVARMCTCHGRMSDADLSGRHFTREGVAAGRGPTGFPAGDPAGGPVRPLCEQARGAAAREKAAEVTGHCLAAGHGPRLRKHKRSRGAGR